MNIANATKFNKLNISQKINNVDNVVEKEVTSPNDFKNIGTEILSNYTMPTVFKGGIKNAKTLYIEKLYKLEIPNLRVLDNNCVRGETLSSKKNKKFLMPVSRSGIKSIIDLRDKYTNQSFEDMCKKHYLRYYHIPVDSSSVDNRLLISHLPQLFKLLNEGNAYIACAQGLHRTDIALAINYIFNPKRQEIPPTMYGHLRDNMFKFEDIARRVNLIKRELSSNDIRMLKWQSIDEFNKEFDMRRKLLIEHNEEIIAKLFR